MKWTVVAFIVTVSAASVVSAQTVIKGRVLGSDGTVLDGALVTVVSAPTEEASADHQGYFNLQTKRHGMVLLEYSAAGHATHRSPVLIEDPTRAIDVEVRLATYDWMPTMDSLRVLGDFNQWDSSGAVPLQRTSSGTYEAVISAPAGIKEIRYQVAGLVPQRHVNGTDGTQCFHESDGEWSTILPVVDGSARIVFDPRLFPPPGGEAKLAFRDRFQHEVAELQGRLDRFRTLFLPKEDEADAEKIAEDVDENTRRIVRALATQTDSMVRRLYQFEYLALLTQSGAQTDSARVLDALRVITPESHVWELDPDVLLNAVSRVSDPTEARGYLDRFLASDAQAQPRAQAAYALVNLARKNSDTAAALRYLRILTTEFSESPYAQQAAIELSPARRVQVGNPVPEFSCASIEDTALVYTPSSMRGRLYLIDFWATWCAPCVAEFPNIQKTYERFHDKGFDVLSFSLDSRLDPVRQFRRTRHPMPWRNAWLRGGYKNALTTQFEVVGIPKTILVDENGIIIATDGLRGDQLERTVARHYGQKE